MINIYNSNENNFNNNGLAILNPNYCNVTEELNGMFYLEMEYKLDGLGKYQYLENDNIIKAPTPRGSQLFRIYLVQKYINNTIKIYAKHIFYDLLMNNVNLTLTNATADRVIQQIISRTDVRTNFTASSNITATNTIELENKDPVTAILGDEGFINLWGGEILRDNYNIQVNTTIGNDLGFKIIYRKNLTGLDVSENYENIITRIKPVARNIDDNPLYLPETYIDSPNIDKYPFPRLYILECSDLRVGQDGLTENQIFAQMRIRAREIYLSEGDLPQVNSKVEFQLLSQTEEYKDYKVLEKVNLGDTVTVLHKPLGVDLIAKCIRYEYDCLQEKYINIELGQFRDTMTDILTSDNTSNITINGVDANLTNHISNTVIHVTQEDRDRWDSDIKNNGVNKIATSLKDIGLDNTATIENVVTKLREVDTYSYISLNIGIVNGMALEPLMPLRGNGHLVIERIGNTPLRFSMTYYGGITTRDSLRRFVANEPLLTEGVRNERNWRELITERT